MLNIHRERQSVWIILAVIILILPSCTRDMSLEPETHLQPELPSSTCLIEPGVPLGGINPLVYGVNHGPWAVITAETLPLAQDAGITMVRFPGGEWGDNNDLQAHHIDQFVALADQMGSEVSINVRLLKGTPEKAAALVEYANIEKGYGIKYWGIGNEPSLFASGRGDPDYGVDWFNEDWRQIALAMKEVDGTILLIGPEIHQFAADIDSTPKDPFGKDWMREFLAVNGDLVDVVSIHRYPFPQSLSGSAATIDALLASVDEWDAIIPYLRNTIIEITGRDLPIAVTEINSHWSNAVGGKATPDSFINAIWWADVMGRLIRNNVEIVNYFTLQSLPSIGGYGLFARTEQRPTYYVYRIYQAFGDNLIFSGCDDPKLSIYAATDQSGGITAIVVNLGADGVTPVLMIEEETRTLMSVWRLDEMNLLHELNLTGYSAGDPIQMPGYSVTLLKFE